MFINPELTREELAFVLEHADENCWLFEYSPAVREKLLRSGMGVEKAYTTERMGIELRDILWEAVAIHQLQKELGVPIRGLTA